MIRILIDSSADLTMNEVAANHIELVPLLINIDEKSYKDELELSRDELFRMMVEEKKSIKTSQPSPQEFTDRFERAKEAGDEIICILLSSSLSGTYQNALLAKSLVGYDKVYVIDSLTATYAIKILVEKALKMIEENHTAEEIVETLEQLKGRTKIIAAMDTLKYLYLGGRVSKTTAIVADAVNVKPAITVTKDGNVSVCGKYLGVGRAVKDIAKQIGQADRDMDYPLYLIYSYQDDNCRKLKKNLEEAGITVDGMLQLGATIGVHIGPGALGAVFVEK